MILRYLLNDNQAMADKTEKYLNAGDVYVTIEIMAEVVYCVLYGYNRVYSAEIATFDKDLLKLLNA